MAKKKGKSSGVVSPRMSPQPGGPPRSALGAAMKKRSTGGWRNAKSAPTGVGSSTDLSTPSSYTSSISEYGGGGRSGASPFHGSLSMPGVIRVKHPTSGPTHFQSAQPAGRAARKHGKMKAPGK